jgi:hypothetical protein
MTTFPLQLVQDLYSSPNLITMTKSRMRQVGHMTHKGGKEKGTRPFRKPEHRLQENIKIFLKETYW